MAGANGGNAEVTAVCAGAVVKRAATAPYAGGGGVAVGMVVISSAVATASSKATYSVIKLAAITFEAPSGAMTFLEEAGRAGARGGARNGRHLNRAFASLGIGRTSRRASFIATPFARRRHYAIRRKRRSTAGRR